MPTTRSHSTQRQESFHDAVTTPPIIDSQQREILQYNPNIKLPQFWTQCPQAWFIQVDTLFELHNVNNDNTKFQHIIASLSQEVILKVLHFIQNPPNIDKYNALKNSLLEKYSLSEDKRFEEIISDTHLGDRKPSELFEEMVTLSGPLSFISRDLIFKLWQRKLPNNVQIHLVSSGLHSFDERVALADKINQMYRPDISVVNSSETHPTEVLKNVAHLTSMLCENVNKMALDICELKNINESYKRNNKNNYNKDVCWYHQRFGNRALKCVEPCKYFSEFQSRNLN